MVKALIKSSSEPNAVSGELPSTPWKSNLNAPFRSTLLHPTPKSASAPFSICSPALGISLTLSVLDGDTRSAAPCCGLGSAAASKTAVRERARWDREHGGEGSFQLRHALAGSPTFPMGVLAPCTWRKRPILSFRSLRRSASRNGSSSSSSSAP